MEEMKPKYNYTQLRALSRKYYKIRQDKFDVEYELSNAIASSQGIRKQKTCVHSMYGSDLKKHYEVCVWCFKILDEDDLRDGFGN